MESSTQAPLVVEPEDMNAAFAAAYNSGDIYNLLSLYESNGILVNSQGRADAGIADIRTTLEELLSLKGYMVSRNVFCIPFENIALLRAHFTLQTQDANGDPIQIEGHTSEIVRKQTDGSWLYIVDHPFGADVLERARVL